MSKPGKQSNMSKKDFKGGLESLIPTQSSEPQIEEAVSQKGKIGRPQTSTRIITKSSQEKCKDGETRATFIINEMLLERIKDIAYWERVMIKEVVDIALQNYVDNYPNGIKDRPKKEKQL